MKRPDVAVPTVGVALERVLGDGGAQIGDGEVGRRLLVQCAAHHARAGKPRRGGRVHDAGEEGRR